MSALPRDRQPAVPDVADRLLRDVELLTKRSRRQAAPLREDLARLRLGQNRPGSHPWLEARRAAFMHLLLFLPRGFYAPPLFTEKRIKKSVCL